MRILVFGALILALIAIGWVGSKKLIQLKGPKSLDYKSEDEDRLTADSSENLTEVSLYFINPNFSDLVSEKRRVAFDLNIPDKVARLIEELVKGSQQKLNSPISKDTDLKKAFVDRNGTAYLDFSSDFSSGSVPGVWGELLMVEAIFRTIGENIAQIKKVQILVDGNEIQTVMGHIDMSQPLSLSQIANR